MLIKDVYRKNVIVTLKNDEKLKGFVIDFENPLESDSGNYCMDLETDLGFYSIDESDIIDIQIITEQHPFYTDKEKVVLFLYIFLTFQCEGYFYCPKRADDILKASMEYQSTDYKRRYISWKEMKVILLT